MFKLDNGVYPTTKDGLTAFIQNINPGRNKNWKGGYMDYRQGAIANYGLGDQDKVISSLRFCLPKWAACNREPENDHDHQPQSFWAR